jgi:transcriptional regulator with XRE-family HTH domain
MPLTDDITRLTSVVVRMLVAEGTPTRLRQRTKLDLSQVGKACGVSASVVGSWEDGVAQPTTQEALAWLTLLYDRQPSTMRQANARTRAGKERT